MKQRTWIHFIGKKYYTINQFIDEANKQGISRAIASQMLKKMEFGDLILLAQKDGSATKIFGGFVFSRIVGIGHFAMKHLQEKNLVKHSSSPGTKIQRGCGNYTVQDVYTITNEKKVMEEIRQMSNIGKAMIGGEFLSIDQIFESQLLDGVDYILSEIPFQMGYRRVDFESIQNELQSKLLDLKGHSQNRRPKLKGQFYIDKDEDKARPLQIDNPKLLNITKYKLN
jgi:hypothetical protein